MATVQPTSKSSSAKPYIPRLTDEELDRSNRELVELLDSWEKDGDEQEQRETLAILREALGNRHLPPSRNAFP